MAGLLDEFSEKLTGLAGKWATYAAFGSFLLYLLGYLTLRFQLSTYGVATNLDLFDEKYLFAGCRFLVYLISSLPDIVITVLALAALGYLPYKLIPVSMKGRLRLWVGAWCAGPTRLPLLGVCLSAALTQFALRKCFAFGNLLLRDRLPDKWLSAVLLASDGELALYFSGLVAGTLVCCAIFLQVLGRESAPPLKTKLLLGVLGIMVAAQCLLLPVNYGVLISTQQLPRVSEPFGEGKQPDGERDWLVWDTKDAVTYFVRDSNDRRSLVTVPRKDSKLVIVAYDDIFCVLFSRNHYGSRPC